MVSCRPNDHTLGYAHDQTLSYRAHHPGTRVTDEAEAIFAGRTLDAVGIFTLADVRPALMRRALASGQHIIAGKPLAADMETEWALVREIEASGLQVAVNLFNRNAWYHKEMQAFIAAGEIGDLGIIRISTRRRA